MSPNGCIQFYPSYFFETLAYNNIENCNGKSGSYQKLTQKTVITKLLQSVTEVYYKVRQVLQSASGITKWDRLLLQSVSGITNCDSYYKVRHNNVYIFLTLSSIHSVHLSKGLD